ncbi:hypothetical protein GN956_G27035 [Arapaima gigas]
MVVVPFFKPSNFCSTRYFPPLDHHYNPIHNHSPSTMVEVESDFNCSNHYNLSPFSSSDNYHPTLDHHHHTPIHNNNPYTQMVNSIPLQFVVQVDSPAPSCTAGEYLPMFQHPTPNHGEVLRAAVRKELNIRVRATARYSTLRNIFISGPLNVTKVVNTSGSTAEAVIKWTPVDNDFGDHVPFCFIAESVAG